MFEHLYQAEKLPDHPNLFADQKGAGYDLDPIGTLPLPRAYVEILPPGLIEDEI